jgi:hypothetical protein
VVAQLIDYASSLWQMSVEDFERAVFHPYLRTVKGADFELPGLIDHLAATFGTDEADEFGDAGLGMDLEQTLRTGRFRLVLAAPTIPPAVQRNIDYMNDQGMLLYGLEVNYFAGDTECFVPRIVVKPRAAELTRIPTHLPLSTESSFLPQLDDRVAGRTATLLRDCLAAGARVEWVADGPRIRTQRRPEAGLAMFYVRQVSITIEPPDGYPVRPYQAAAETLAPIVAGSTRYNGTVWAARYARLSDDELDAVFRTILMLAQTVALPVDFSVVDPAIQADFVRNDNNLWLKVAPALAPCVGRWLRGTLAAGPASEAHPVTLEPLADAQPGWRPPRFESVEVARSVWPPNHFDGDYRLTSILGRED